MKCAVALLSLFTSSLLAQNPLVNATQLRGRNISTTAPTNGQVYVWNASTGFWTPGASSGGGVTSVSGTANQVCVATGTTTPVLSICTALDLSGLTSTKPIKSGTSLPATCGVGEFYDKTDATAGSNLYSCTATNTWTVVGGGASPAGSTTEMQYRFDATTFGATSGMSWNATTNKLTTNQEFTAISTNQIRTISSIMGVLDPTDTVVNIYGGTSSYVYVDDGSGNLGGPIWASSSIIDNENNRDGKTVTHAFSHDFEVDNYGASLAVNMGGVDVTFFIGAPITNLYGSWVEAPFLQFGAMPTNLYGYYASDFAAKATNPYYSWFDSTGVRRVKEDSTFNSVGQAIEALYNPQFTKYTPGAANYERGVLGQWESNVFFITTENGGTGTLRNIQIDGAEVDLGTSSHLVNIPAASFLFNGLTCSVVAGAIACS